MEAFLADLFSLALSPITSHSLLVWIPACLAFVYGCFSLFFCIVRRL